MRLNSLTIAGWLIALALAASPAWAQDLVDEPLWLDDLRFQLEESEDCEVLYFINVDEGKLGNRITHEARATCSDGRQFDAIRILPEIDFTLSRCEVQTC